ncbi:hypothetical protein [Limnohabitans sp. Jir72]|uniref:hypothetical protein n=1 Tax=Limnohabitans sp. Jir72 TaxID=1977909 RepID=UPI0011B20B0E|nr:hypothetical protein [Limnohabitans sp. Jir72]
MSGIFELPDGTSPHELRNTAVTGKRSNMLAHSAQFEYKTAVRQVDAGPSGRKGWCDLLHLKFEAAVSAPDPYSIYKLINYGGRHQKGPQGPSSHWAQWGHANPHPFHRPRSF